MCRVGRAGRVAVVALWLSLMVGCSEKPVGAVVTDTPRREWMSPVTITYTNTDSLAVCNLAIVARVESGLVEKAFGLQVCLTAPSGRYFKSEVVLRAERRHSGGSFTELRSGWIEKGQLAEVGDYILTLTPVDTLSGVWSVGADIVDAQ